MTTTAVPSLLPEDFTLNIENLDKFSNSTASTFANRLGVVKPTVAGSVAQVASKVAEVEVVKNTAITVTIPEKIAEIDPIIAASYVGQAEAQAVLAAAAKTGAELARDVAQAVGRSRPSIAAALADTTITVGQSFAAPLADGSLQAYMKDSTIAATAFGAPFATSASVAAVAGISNRGALLLGYGAADTATVVIGSLPAATLTLAGSAGASFWGRLATTAADSLLSSFSVEMGAAGNVQLLLVDSGNIVLWDQTVACALGVNTLPISSGIVPAGTRAYVKPLSGSIKYVSGGTDVNFASASYNGIIGDVVNAPANTGSTLCIAFTFTTAVQSVKAAITANTAKIAASVSEVNRSTVLLGYKESDLTGVETIGATPANTGAISSTSLLYWGRQTLLQRGGRANAISARMTIAGNVQLLLVVDNIVVYDKVIACDVGLNSYPITDAPMIPAGGSPVVRVLSGSMGFAAGLGTTTAAASYNGVVGDTVDAPTLQPNAVCCAVTFATGPDSVKAQLGTQDARLTAVESGSGVGGTDEKIVSATAGISGLAVTISGSLFRNSVVSTVSGALTLTAPAGSDVRYDVIYYNAASGLCGVQAGTPRAADASELIPALTSASYLPLFNCRVTASTVTTVPIWGVENNEVKSLSVLLEQSRRRSRACIPKTLAKIRRGAALRIVSLGDSIMAMQNGAPSETTPDGPVRDLVTGYFPGYIGVDLYGALPKYTAVQSGHADDGIGANHIKASSVWRAVNALEAMGQPVTYNNFSIAAKSSANLVDGAFAPTTWLNSAVAFGGDVVILGMGMNEIGNTLTEARMTAVVNAFKAVGTEVIVMGVARPLNATVANWEYTNRVLERVAKFTSSAFVSMVPIYDDRYLGVIGCAAEDICSANKINHPGINEHIKMGAQLLKLLVA